MESGPDSAGGRANLIPQAGGRARIRVSSRRRAGGFDPGGWAGESRCDSTGGPAAGADPGVNPQVGRRSGLIWIHRWVGGWRILVGIHRWADRPRYDSTGGPEMIFDGKFKCNSAQ